MIGKIIPLFSQLRFIALAADIMHGHGPSNKMHHQLQPKKTQVRLYWSLIKQQQVSYALYITSKRENGPYL